MRWSICWLACALMWGVETPPVDEHVLMADYHGANRTGTILERKTELAKMTGRTTLLIRINEWPTKISVQDPTADPVSDLGDGDRGFVWQMSEDQLVHLVMKRLDARKTLTIEIGRDANKATGLIKEWADAQGFSTVVYQ